MDTSVRQSSEGFAFDFAQRTRDRTMLKGMALKRSRTFQELSHAVSPSLLSLFRMEPIMCNWSEQ